MHTEFRNEQKTADTLIIFVHGFLGSPNQFCDLSQAVFDKGYSSVSLLLPGHGKTGKEFAKCMLCDWENYLQQEISSYCTKYDRVFVVGHSMGGLLALNASLVKENKICGVFLISSPMKINYISLRSFSSRFKLIFCSKNSAVKQSYKRSFGITKTPFYIYPLWLKQVGELKKLIKKTEANLFEIRTPVVIVNSKADEIVSFKSLDIFYEGLKNTAREKLVLQKSMHAHYVPEERTLILEKLLQFIK